MTADEKKFAPPQGVLMILNRLEQAGWEAWTVGGCVRDSLLGKKPSDWDICTAAPPSVVQALFGGERPAVSVVVGVPPVDDGQGEPPMPAEASSSEKGEGQKDALDELLAFGEQFDNIVIQ